MIKIITIITKFIVATLIALFFTSCNVNRNTIKGSGTITKENRPVTADFKSIEVAQSIEVLVEQTDKSSILVKADDNLQKHITTTIKDGVLEIKSDVSFNVGDNPKVSVQMPIVEGLKSTSASEIKSKNTLKGEKITVETSSGGEINVVLEFDTISGRSSSGSKIILAGKALKLDAKSSSGSGIDAKNVLVNDVVVAASSGSSVQTHPIVRLDAKASSGADITYTNQPKSITQKADSGGSIDEE
jgi:Putative auto-transporter adhesin, head GIN domain